MGLDAALEATEEMIDKGWCRLIRIEGTIDPSDGEVKPFYSLQLWNPFKRKYVSPGGHEPQMNELRRCWAGLEPYQDRPGTSVS